MTLETGVKELAEAVGTDVKSLNATIGDLSQLPTYSKNNLVDAINEIIRNVYSVVVTIDDDAGLGDTDVTWSADKISREIGELNQLTTTAKSNLISTSDEREKQQIKPIDAAVIRAWAKVEYCQFKFNDSVEVKGDGARWHFGLIAQRVKEAFESEGLDAFEYGVLCYDEWIDDFAPVLGTRLNEEGEEEEYETGEERLVRSAGNRYGIRYEEALALECAYLRSRLDGLPA